MVASILADSTRYFPSSPQRETTRGRSWLFMNRLFQPWPWSPCCHRSTHRFSRTRGRGIQSHFSPPGLWSRQMCSNWNTMLSSRPSWALYFLARSTSAPHASPTVTRPSSMNASRDSSSRNSWSRGPLPVIFRSGSLAIWSMTSSRKPSTPLSTQKRIISYSSRRRTGFSQFRSGCCTANWWK